MQAAFRARRLSARRHIENILTNARLQEQDAEATLSECRDTTMETDFKLPLPMLGKPNFKIWKLALLSYADEHGILDMLTTPAPATTVQLDEAQERKKRAKALRLLISTISAGVITRIGDDILDCEPRIMLQKIDQYYTADQSPAVHEALRERAAAMLIRLKKRLTCILRDTST
eukprot:IDg5748t1